MQRKWVAGVVHTGETRHQALCMYIASSPIKKYLTTHIVWFV